MPYEQQIALLFETGRQRAVTLTGMDVAFIIVPLAKDRFEYLLQTSQEFK